MEQLLLRFVETLDASVKRLLARVGQDAGFSKLTVHQLQYLDAIAGLGQPTATQLAERLKITKASVTAGVGKLVQLGFVTKTQSEQDRRVYHLRLTESSAVLVQAKYQALQEYGDFIRQVLSEEEADAFEKTLAKLVNVHFG